MNGKKSEGHNESDNQGREKNPFPTLGGGRRWHGVHKPKSILPGLTMRCSDAMRRSAGFQTCCIAGLQACRALGRTGVLRDVARRSRLESLRYSSIPPVALRGQAGYNLRCGGRKDRRGSTGASPYRCDCDSLGCRRINRCGQKLLFGRQECPRHGSKARALTDLPRFGYCGFLAASPYQCYWKSGGYSDELQGHGRANLPVSRGGSDHLWYHPRPDLLSAKIGEICGQIFPVGSYVGRPSPQRPVTKVHQRRGSWMSNSRTRW